MLRETTHLARLISVLGHPFVLSPLVLAWASTRFVKSEKAVWLAGSVVVLVVLPVSLFILWKTRRGQWTNFDVSEKSHRPRFYLILVTLTALTAVALRAMEAPPASQRGTWGIAVLLAAAGIINHWLKISLHTAISMYLGCALAGLDLVAGLLLVVAALLIGWSRVTLGRHSRAEVVCGLLLGAAGGLLVVLV